MLAGLRSRGKIVCRILERFDVVVPKKGEACLTGAFYSTYLYHVIRRRADFRNSSFSFPALRHVQTAPEALPPLEIAGIRNIHSAGVSQGPALSDSELQELGVAPKKSVIFDTKLKRLHVSYPLEPSRILLYLIGSGVRIFCSDWQM